MSIQILYARHRKKIKIVPSVRTFIMSIKLMPYVNQRPTSYRTKNSPNSKENLEKALQTKFTWTHNLVVLCLMKQDLNKQICSL